jgi:GDP-L-fucose synthase
MSTILLTGHKGLVGSAIAKEIDCITTNRIENYDTFDIFLKDYNIDTIIHTAAKVGGVKANLENKIDFYIQNSNLNNIVFEAAYKNNIQRLINFSSTCVFPDKANLPLTENQVFNGPPHYTNDAYAYSKRMMQLLCNIASEQGYGYVTLIPTNIFGPNDNYNLNNCHVLPALIHKCFLAKQNNDTFIVWGSGKPLREFIYSKDLAKLIKTYISKPLMVPYESFILPSYEEKSIQECAELIAKILNFNGDIKFDTTKPEGQFRKPANSEKFEKFVDTFNPTPFEQAIEESISWFVDNYPNVRK